MLPEFSLQGRVAIVTGASRGIGRAIAETMAEAGADIVAAARTLPALEETAAAVRAKGMRCHVVQADVCVQADLERMTTETVQQFGTVDILVNNAGREIVGPVAFHKDVPTQLARQEALTLEEWELVLRTNLTSMFLACKAVGPHMMERRYGKVINISSIQGATQLGGLATGSSAYSTSKAAIMHFTRSLALEWAPFNITVNSLSPGCFWTAIWENPELQNSPEARQRVIDDMAAYIPLHRWGDLREVGLLAVYMASPASDYLTGQVIHLDGGFTAK